jgi:hypothetical protein
MSFVSLAIVFAELLEPRPAVYVLRLCTQNQACGQPRRIGTATTRCLSWSQQRVGKYVDVCGRARREDIIAQ